MGQDVNDASSAFKADLWISGPRIRFDILRPHIGAWHIAATSTAAVP
jgi:hypothetical protein